MNNITLSFLLVLLITACNKDKPIDTDLPRCLMAMVESENLQLPVAAIQVQEVKGDLHYKVIVNAFHVDYDIVDKNCNVLCYIGHTYHPSGCSENYSGNWTTIWEQ